MQAALALRLRLASVAALLLLWQFDGISQSTFGSDPVWSPRLVLTILDDVSGVPVASRFTVTVDEKQHEPRWVGPHGVRFPSVHVAKRQSKIVTYARGSGPVWVPLTPGAKTVRVDATKGFDYLPASAQARVEGESVRITLRLQRWSQLREQGWRAADAHLHYDRVDPAGDRDWFAMMAGDDIAHTQFMALKGGMVQDVWARQYAYGESGEAVSNGRTIVAGEEYRDRLQGHLLFFGIREVIQPIMAGVPGSPHNFPLFPDVLAQARDLGALTGAAHGGTLGGRPTVLLDAVLGKLDFVEIANWVTGLWPLENWYRLLNCGYLLPPTAGTDLPNNPQREPWQPFLGGMRMYAKTGGSTGSEAWDSAVKRGETFVTNGPSIELDVNGVGPGGLVCLPSSGGDVAVQVRLRSPRDLGKSELIQQGLVVASSDQVSRDGDVTSILLEMRLPITRSTWLAARGEGKSGVIPGGAEVAHTAAVGVIVGSEPIWSDADADTMRASLAEQRDFYLREGRYASDNDRSRMARLFDQAAEEMQNSGTFQGKLKQRPCEQP